MKSYFQRYLYPHVHCSIIHPGYKPRVRFQGHDSSILNSLRNLRAVSTVAVPAYISTDTEQVLLFHKTITSTWYLLPS